MLKFKNEENVILVYIVVILIVVGINIILNANMLDIGYFLIMLYCFIKFLIIKFK